MASVLIVSWNLAGRVQRLGEQAERLLALEADHLCLQEVTPNTLIRWEVLLSEAGYDAIQHGEPDPCTERSRPLMVLVASRRATKRVTVADVPWPERVLAVKLADGTELINVHSPISPKPDLAKVRTHEAVYAHLAENTVSHPRILCGDLNTPRKEHPDGRIWTFARDRYGRLREERGERWDQAELALIRGLEPYGFRDAFRTIHGPTRKELSWEWPRWGGGYRLDHLLTSAECTVEDCRYEHEWRKEGLSDHSALVARVRRG
ncbi:MAG TPA: endonuclease/exonuclease/phosphatase family protein [Solirubrobacteraceae bacterium]